MNQTIRATVQRLAPEYSKRTDSEIIEVIKTGRYSGEALFYILFGRYHDMLHTLFKQEATSAMEFSDFMLKLQYRLNATNNRYRGTGAGNTEKSRF